MFAWVRLDGAGDMVACITNFSATPHSNYTIGLPKAGVWKEILNTDSEVYDGTGTFGNLGQVTAYDVGWGTFEAHASLALPAMGSVWLHYDASEEVETAVGGANA